MRKIFKNPNSKKEPGTVNYRKRGFTLVELIVSMSLFIVVIFITTSTFLTLTTLYKSALTTRTALDDVNTAVETMARSIRTGSLYTCSDVVNGNDAFGVYRAVYSGGDLKNREWGNAAPLYGPGPTLMNNIKDCDLASGGKPWIVFLSGEGDVWYFRIKHPPGGLDYISYGRVKDNFTGSLTISSAMKLDRLRFFVIGSENTTLKQPRVMIVVQGTAGTDSRTQTKFSIYTSVTQRVPKY